MNKSGIDFELAALKVLNMLLKKLDAKKGIEYRFATVVINANIAEYLLHVLINTLSLEVNKICNEKGKNVKLEIIDPTGNSNRQKIEVLEYFEFKNKKEIITRLKKIQSDRNNVFHNLVRSHTKQINIDNAIADVTTNTVQLRTLVSQTLSNIWGDTNK